MKDRLPASQHEKVINAQLRRGDAHVSASDWLRPDRTRVNGNTICLFLSGWTRAELQVTFEGLSVGASLIDPLTEQFFGTYGALTDKFGIRWMFQANKAD